MEKVHVNSQQEMINKHCLSNYTYFRHFIYAPTKFQEFFNTLTETQNKRAFRAYTDIAVEQIVIMSIDTFYWK